MTQLLPPNRGVAAKCPHLRCFVVIRGLGRSQCVMAALGLIPVVVGRKFHVVTGMVPRSSRCRAVSRIGRQCLMGEPKQLAVCARRPTQEGGTQEEVTSCGSDLG